MLAPETGAVWSINHKEQRKNKALIFGLTVGAFAFLAAVGFLAYC